MKNIQMSAVSAGVSMLTGSNWKQSRWLTGLSMVLIAVLMTACGSESGTTTKKPGSSSSSGGGGNTASAVSDRAAFESSTYPLLVKYCVTCHGGTGSSPPPFANGNVDLAYKTITQKLLADKTDAARSRIVVKVAEEKHNCWSVNCGNDALELQKSVEIWAGLQVDNTTTSVPTPTMTLRSAATTFAASQGASAVTKRVNSNLLALYTFKEGSGTTVRDVSGATPAMDLTLSAAGVEWVTGQGLKFTAANAKAQATADTSRKLFDQITGGATPANAFTVEAWLINTNTTQGGPARIVSYAIDNGNSNFSLVQNADRYGVRTRSSATGVSVNGEPIVTSAAGTLKTGLTHVVATFDGTVGRKIYLNGADTGVTDPSIPALLNNWNSSYLFSIGNTPPSDRSWPGTVYLVAVYNRALNGDQVRQNFNAGFVDRSILTFDIAQVSGVAGAAIVLEASALDKASYLFARPTYSGPDPNGLSIKGIQVLINNKLPGAGQAFRNVDVLVDDSTLELSDIGTVMAKDRGENTDSFVLTFETMGSRSEPVIEPPPGPLGMEIDARSVIPTSGVRTYEQINNTFAALTGVSTTATGVTNVFGQVKQQLPANANVLSFLSSQQTGIAKLAVEYCDAMIESGALRNAFFDGTPAFEFGSGIATSFSTQAKKDRIANTLINKMIGTNLTSQPTLSEAQLEIGSLLNDLIAAVPAGDQVRTRAVVKGACAAVISSAAMTVN